MFSIPACISSNKCVCGAKYTFIYNIRKQGREYLDFKWLHCQNNTTWPAPKVTEWPESTVLSWESIWLFTGWWVCTIFDHICLILLGRTNSADAILSCEGCPCLFFRLFFAKSRHVSARGFGLLGLSFILVLSGLSLRPLSASLHGAEKIQSPPDLSVSPQWPSVKSATSSSTAARPRL